MKSRLFLYFMTCMLGLAGAAGGHVHNSGEHTHSACGVEGCMIAGEHTHGTCGVDGCTITGEHTHSACGVEGCTIAGEHTHAQRLRSGRLHNRGRTYA